MTIERTSPEGNARARWVGTHWWRRNFELIWCDKVIATVRMRGFRGTAEIDDRLYAIRRFRSARILLKPGTDEPVARLDLLPVRGGMPAELPNGEMFQLGWTRWWKREWRWTNQAGDQVLSSSRSWRSGRYDLRIESAADRSTWPLLAILELTIDK